MDHRASDSQICPMRRSRIGSRAGVYSPVTAAVNLVVPLITALVLCTSVVVSAAPVKSSLITPGRSVGSVSLGMLKGDVVRTWGTPETVRATGRTVVYVYRRYGTTVGLWEDVVTWISTWNTKIKTREGVGPGSRRSQVFRTFGPPQETKEVNIRRTIVSYNPVIVEVVLDVEYWYHTRGIAFGTSIRVRTGARAPNDPTIDYVTVEEPK